MFDNNAHYLELHVRSMQAERDMAVSRPLSQRRDDERIIHERSLPVYRALLSLKDVLTFGTSVMTSERAKGSAVAPTSRNRWPKA